MGGIGVSQTSYLASQGDRVFSSYFLPIPISSIKECYRITCYKSVTVTPKKGITNCYTHFKDLHYHCKETYLT